MSSSAAKTPRSHTKVICESEYALEARRFFLLQESWQWETVLGRVVRLYPELSRLGRRLWARGLAETKRLDPVGRTREIEAQAPKDPRAASRGLETGMVEAMGYLFRGWRDYFSDPAGLIRLPVDRREGAPLFGVLMGQSTHYPCCVHLFVEEAKLAETVEAIGLDFFRWAEARGRDNKVRLAWHLLRPAPLDELDSWEGVAGVLGFPVRRLGATWWGVDRAGLVTGFRKPTNGGWTVSGGRPSDLRELGEASYERRTDDESWAMPFPRKDLEAWFEGVKNPASKNCTILENRSDSSKLEPVATQTVQVEAQNSQSENDSAIKNKEKPRRGKAEDEALGKTLEKTKAEPSQGESEHEQVIDSEALVQTRLAEAKASDARYKELHEQMELAFRIGAPRRATEAIHALDAYTRELEVSIRASISALSPPVAS